jgi:hypothetical protein
MGKKKPTFWVGLAFLETSAKIPFIKGRWVEGEFCAMGGAQHKFYFN